MDITPKQLETLLAGVVDDRLDKRLTPIQKQIDGLTRSVDKAVKKWDDHLNQNWKIHLGDTHKRIDRRLGKHDKAIGVNTEFA